MPNYFKFVFTLFLLTATLLPVRSSADSLAASLRSPLQSASSYIKRHNPVLTDQDAQTFAAYVLEYAQEFDLDPRLLLAIMKVESRFDPDASNSHGRGLMQVVPRWHLAKIKHARKRFNVHSLFEPQLNLFVGAWIFRENMNVSKSVREALLRYNGTLADPRSTYANLVLRESRTIQL